MLQASVRNCIRTRMESTEANGEFYITRFKVLYVACVWWCFVVSLSAGSRHQRGSKRRAPVRARARPLERVPPDAHLERRALGHLEWGHSARESELQGGMPSMCVVNRFSSIACCCSEKRSRVVSTPCILVLCIL